MGWHYQAQKGGMSIHVSYGHGGERNTYWPMFTTKPKSVGAGEPRFSVGHPKSWEDPRNAVAAQVKLIKAVYKEITKACGSWVK